MAVLDTEKLFVTRLAAYLDHAEDFNFQVSAFTDFDSLLAFEKCCEIELLLCSIHFYHQAEQLELRQLYLLDVQENEAYPDNLSIYKYQSAGCIKKRVQLLCRRKEMLLKSAEPSEVKTIAFISPSGGSFCSTTALTAALLHGDLSRTLFLSFDPFLSISGITGCSFGITEAVQLLRQNKKVEELKECIRHSADLDFLTGCLHWADLTEIAMEEAELLINKLKELGYEKIMIDIGCFCRATAGILKSCDVVYELNYGTPGEEEKRKEWLRQYKMNCRESEGRSKKLKPPYEERLNGKGIELNALKEGMLSEYLKKQLCL